MKEIPIEIEAQYPQKAVAGVTYTMMIDLSFNPEETIWTFDREEIPIYCLISSSLFTIKYPEKPVFLLHRYGGTYGKLTFLLKAVDEIKSGEVTIILLSDGITVGHVDLKSEIIDISKDKGKKLELQEKVVHSHQKPHKSDEKNVILVVEDDSAVRILIRDTLEQLYTVVEANDGMEGIEKAKEIIPDLIVSDVMMPEKDGYTLCRELKKDINTSHIPIILLSSKTSEESFIKSMGEVDDYISKPLNARILITRIKNLIDLRRELQLNIQRQKMLMPDGISLSSMDEKFLKEFLDVIEKNLSDPDFNTDMLSKKMNMEGDTLSKKIKALTGETPNQFIRSYYKTIGVKLLKDKEKKIKPEQELNISHQEQPIAKEKNVILVVDDSPGIREYIGKALEPTYTVAEAVNGREGIQKAKDIIPDLIISDIMMPEVDGYELCIKLKHDIETSHIPIIFLSAKDSEESIIKVLEIGADDYITKPFNTKILSTRIKNLIELRRQLQMKIQRQKTLMPYEIAISSMDETFLNEFQGIVEKNLSDPDFNIGLLSKKLYMGRTTLFRKIEALTGQTPNQFILSYRLQRAAQLLKANFGNVTQVAFKVGFSSSAYFTKCFKEKFHQLPSTFQTIEASYSSSKDLDIEH